MFEDNKPKAESQGTQAPTVEMVAKMIDEGIRTLRMPEMIRRTGLTAESLARIACGAKVRRSTMIAAAVGLGLAVEGPAAIRTAPLPTA